MSNCVDLPLLILPGEPAGIGPDLVLAAAAAGGIAAGSLIIADPQVLEERRRLLDIDIDIATPDNSPGSSGASLQVLPVAARRPVRPGVLDSNNAPYVLECLDQALDLCLSGRAAALVTGPVHKGIINEAGRAFTGHTEYLAARCNTPKPVMMLATRGLRIALLTTHLPLARVAAQVKRELVEQTLEIIDRDMRERFGMARPRICVTGLNPHAGEGGHLGHEEIDEIIPAIENCRGRGMDISGPLPADTAFIPKYLRSTDVFLAMYHDQGLPVLKYTGFGEAVNVTLGLPCIRTSVDHGVALELAGSGTADPGSLIYAIETARAMAAQSVSVASDS